MRSDEAPRRVQEHLSVQPVGEETLVYDELRHKAFCLNRSSAAIWRLANGERSVDAMRVLASAELGMEVGEEFVWFAVEQLRSDGLIEPARTPAAAKPVSRRAMLQRLGAGGAMLLPAIASIVAPTAAQAYSGCFDCDVSPSVRASRIAKANQVERMRRQQQLLGDANGDLFGPLSPYPRPENAPPDDPFPQ
jgi:hypothetical protein